MLAPPILSEAVNGRARAPIQGFPELNAVVAEEAADDASARRRTSAMTSGEKFSAGNVVTRRFANERNAVGVGSEARGVQGMGVEDTGI
jgi:hypothetical protein